MEKTDLWRALETLIIFIAMQNMEYYAFFDKNYSIAIFFLQKFTITKNIFLQSGVMFVFVVRYWKYGFGFNW